MPKVVSRAAVSSSDTAIETQSSQAILRSHYCLCGEFILVIDRSLDKLPRRKTDGAYIIRSKDGKRADQAARKFKLNVTSGKRCLIKREGSTALEPRLPLMCSRCNTTVAYQVEPLPVGSGRFVYVHKGGVTEQQGRIPPDAFDGEDLLPAAGDEDETMADSKARGDAQQAARRLLEEEERKRLRERLMHGSRKSGLGQGVEVLNTDDDMGY